MLLLTHRRGQAMNRSSITLIALGFLAGCATAPPPPLTADNPASPSAPEAPLRVTRNALGIDDLTKKTRHILAQTAEDQRQSDQSGPDTGDQKEQPMKSMPNMPSPEQQSSSPSPTPQQQQMPGMQSPQGQSQPSSTPNN
jgi:hypothetical protein